MEKLIEIINNFKGKKIAVIGDLMLDQFILGEARRISPEAPVPVVLVKRETLMPGGAANTANNIASLGGSVFMLGVVGDDSSGKQLLQGLKTKNINIDGVFILSNKPTTQKMRIVAQGQQVVRVDREDTNYIEKEIEEKILNFIDSSLKNWDAIVISDYGKGLVTENLVKKTIDLALKNQKIIIGNTKKANHAPYFKNIGLLIANSEEAAAIAGKEGLEISGKKIQEELDCDMLITQGSEGMTLFEKENIEHFSTKAREVFDVSGAGDTVVSAFALSLTSKATLKEAAIVANHAAGIVVGKMGTATVSLEELKKSLECN
jgi:D-glycero-beta-D-manno-heptose-7-phosphate kinase